jgi:hypothetical protein
MLAQETAVTLGKFIFNNILCRWGALSEIIMDNGPPFIVALDWLAKKYHIYHIRISAYNKQANSLVEHSHCTIWESIVKACEGDISRWPQVTPHIFWADRATVKKSIGYSLFYLAHGIEPVLPFDIVEATYLVPKIDQPLSTADLIALRARQLEKHPADLEAIKERVLKSRYMSIAQFEKEHENLIIDYNFKEGSLVLVRNSRIETDLSRKTKPRYLGPLIVIRRTRNKAYILAELDGAVHKRPFTAFRLIPYYPCSCMLIPVMSLIDPADVPIDNAPASDSDE